ncbi:ubiquitin domain-containing protein [Amylocarpus encephaloides]|uniref:Ubiquitin domain-containing protein n=1 Tax=Amylocarpus encephaloides TaxID=45428 RepID=A0A9P7YEU3_9HELO|nr:ubiquitin domain-containing protein [Amylocarpus encephaloides]
MGCCASTSRASSSPYPPEPNSSSRGITSSQPQSHSALPRPSTHASSHSNRHSHHRSSQPLSAHINKPLKIHVWACKNRNWTRADLDRERTDFFDTRVTGRPEIWQTLRAVLEILWAGGDIGDVDGGIGTAQQILDAADITIPTGDLSNGVYDGFGAFYTLPEFIVADPQNIASTPPTPADEVINTDGESDELDEEELVKRREEKGKGVLSVKDMIHVTARLSDGGGPDLVLSVGRDDSVRLVARRLAEEASLSPPKSIRIAYLGKILRDNQSLIAQGWKDDHVVNALVFG